MVFLAAAACGPAADAALPPTVSPPLPTAMETPTPSVSLELPPELTMSTETPLQHFTFPTSGAVPVSAWRPPPYPAPWSLRPGDHFDFSRPIPSGDVNWAHPLYRYGYTFFGEESVHTGVDLGADRNAPVVAAADGEVVWAGYGLYTGTRDLSDPYGLAIAILHDFGYNDQPLYTVYAHLARIEVWMGQRVTAGEEIGLVGDTGHASGPHLHFEVRLGENRYYATRNPELWIVPPEGWGVLAGRILDTAGRPIPEHQVQVRSLETGQRWEAWTYAAQSVNGDDVLGENLALADLPAGAYEITTLYLGRPRTASLWVYPGQTNFFTFQGTQGYVVEPTPAPPDLTNPPLIP
jgi:hypothetical protein